MTASEALAAGAAVLERAGIADARREVGALMRAVLAIDARLHPERALAPAAVDALAAAVARRACREPFAHVVGRREFHGLELVVGSGLFIPRTETETLVDTALRHWTGPDGVACDLCSGSGAVAVALAAARPGARIDATDLSPAAVAATAANASRLHLAQRVRAFQGDLFTPLPRARLGGYEFCTCNPPYVEAAAWHGLQREVRQWEPHAALVPPEGWRALYRRLAAGALRWLKPGGRVLAEVGAGQALSVAAIWRAEGLVDTCAHRDLAGIARVVEGRRP